MNRSFGIAGRIAGFFVDSKLTILVVLASVMLGAMAVVLLPREEEPQIIVPMIDVFVQAPGMTAKEVEERVSKPMEKLLWEIPGRRVSLSLPLWSVQRHGLGAARGEGLSV